jgi:hypothetical protein
VKAGTARKTEKFVCTACRRGTEVVQGGQLGVDEYVDKLTAELHERIEHQRNVLKCLLSAESDSERIAYCPIVDCPRLKKLRDVLGETIHVLEETRSSFKSKRLEVMRKKLRDILAGC